MRPLQNYFNFSIYQEKKLWFEFFARLLTYKYLIVNKLLCFYFEIIDLSIILGV